MPSPWQSSGPRLWGPTAPEQLWIGNGLGSRFVSFFSTFLSRPGETRADRNLQRAWAQALGKVAQIKAVAGGGGGLLKGGGCNTEGPAGRDRESNPGAIPWTLFQEVPSLACPIMLPPFSPSPGGTTLSPCFCSAPGWRWPHQAQGRNAVPSILCTNPSPRHPPPLHSPGLCSLENPEPLISLNTADILPRTQRPRGTP